MLEYKIGPSIDDRKIRDIGKKLNIDLVNVKIESDSLEIKSAPLTQEQEAKLQQAIGKETKIEKLRFETVGATLGAEKLKKTAFAAALSILAILIYMLFAFKKLSHGLSAVIAMLHDFFVLVGIYILLTGFFDAQIDTLFVTAVLTTAAFSVHDTIVVFDKIRELQRQSGEGIALLANRALTATLVRSVNNSLTIILMLIPLTVFGGEQIRFFAAALLIGTITGTYSSPFIATPVLVFLTKMFARRP